MLLKAKFCSNALRAYKARSDERAASQLPDLMPSGQSLLGNALSPSLVFLTTLNLAMSGDICICSPFLESIMCVSHVSDKGKGKAHNALQKKIKLIFNIFLLHIVLDCFMTEVYSTMQFFKPSSHTFLQVHVSHLQFPGHTNLFLRQAFTEKLVLMYF